MRLPREILADATDLTVSTPIRWDGATAPWQWMHALGKDTSRYLFSTSYDGDGRLRTAVTTAGGGGEAQVTGYAGAAAECVADPHRHPRHDRRPRDHLSRRRRRRLGPDHRDGR